MQRSHGHVDGVPDVWFGVTRQFRRVFPVDQGHGVHLTQEGCRGFTGRLRDVRLPETIAVKDRKCDIEPVQEPVSRESVRLCVPPSIWVWTSMESLQPHQIMPKRPQYLFQNLLLIFPRRNAHAHPLSPSRHCLIEDRLPRIAGVDVVWMAFGLHRLARPFRRHEFLNHLRIIGHDGPDNVHRLIMRVLETPPPRSIIPEPSCGFRAGPARRGISPGATRVGRRTHIRGALAFLAWYRGTPRVVRGPASQFAFIRGNGFLTALLLVVTVGALDATEQT